MAYTTYNKIGIGYDETRRADPYLAKRMFQLLDPPVEGRFLDVGCGTGNYTQVLHQKGLEFIGIDPSEEMLSKARLKAPGVEWRQGTAENIDLPDHCIDGVLVSLTIHHWTDLRQGFSEIYRVLKPGGRMVLFTSLPEQTGRYWLAHYFPGMIRDSMATLPALDTITTALSLAGFGQLEQEIYEVQPDLQDWFLYCGKHDPERYFREEIRKGISSFSALSNEDEVVRGLAMLRQDIDNGQVHEVMQRFQHDDGDYLFIISRK